MVCSRYPKECRYYDTKLKIKCLQLLKINVWENKVKWKLIRKADTHYKIKTLCKCFNLWSTFLFGSLQKRKNNLRAKEHYVRKIKIKAFAAFKKNLQNTLMFYKVCIKKIEWNRKYRAWHEWKHYVEKRGKVKQIKSLANKIRHERIILKFLYIWSFRFKEIHSLKVAYQTAATKHNHKLLEKYFSSWKIFKQRKVCKKQIEKLSVICYEDKLKERIFLAWVEYKNQKSHYKTQQNLIQTFYKNYLLNAYIAQWFNAHKQLNTKLEIYNTNLADIFYKRKLLGKSFETLLDFSNSKKLMRKKQLNFQIRYRYIFFTHYINIWVERSVEKLVWLNLENKAIKWREFYLIELTLTKISDKYLERKEERQQMLNAVKYYKAIITHKTFEKWLEFTVRRINKKIKIENAMEFCLEKTQEKAFSAWKKFLLRKKQKQTASTHYENVILARALDVWKMFLEERKAKMLEVVNLEKKYKLKVMKNAFAVWKMETDYVKANLRVAVNFYRKSKLSKTFEFWKKFAEKQKNLDCKYNCNKNILNSIIIKSVIRGWYKQLTVKRNLNKKIEEICEKRNNRIIILHFNNWLKFVKKRKNIVRTVEYFPVAKCVFILEYYLNCMMESLSFSRVLKRKQEMARKIEEKLLKRRYLRMWVGFVCWKKLKIVNCMYGREEDPCGGEEVQVPTRRQPIIPEFLKNEWSFEEFQDDCTILNSETFRVSNPVNKKLPIVGQKGSYVSFEV